MPQGPSFWRIQPWRDPLGRIWSIRCRTPRSAPPCSAIMLRRTSPEGKDVMFFWAGAWRGPRIFTRPKFLKTVLILLRYLTPMGLEAFVEGMRKTSVLSRHKQQLEEGYRCCCRTKQYQDRPECRGGEKWKGKFLDPKCAFAICNETTNMKLNLWIYHASINSINQKKKLVKMKWYDMVAVAYHMTYFWLCVSVCCWILFPFFPLDVLASNPTRSVSKLIGKHENWN